MSHINARPNLNGNTPADFHGAASRLMNAIELVNQALFVVRADIMHGRNYQREQQMIGSAMREEDFIRLGEAFIALGGLQQLAIDINLAGEN